METGIITMTEDTGWKRYSNNETDIGYNVLYRRVGKTVYIKSDGDVSGLESNTPIGSISEDCRTGIEMWFPCYAAYPVYAPNVYLRIYPGGSTTLGLATNSGVTKDTSIYVSASYVL